MRAILGLSLLPVLATAFPFTDTSIHKDAAPVLSAANAQEIDDSYIVVFKKHVGHETASQHHEWVQDLHIKTEQILKTDLKKRSYASDVYDGLKHTYNVAGELLGYSGNFHEDVIEEIRRHPDVSTFDLVLLRAMPCNHHDIFTTVERRYGVCWSRSHRREVVMLRRSSVLDTLHET